MPTFASILAMAKIQYFQQVVCHIMKSVSTCTYRYTYHDLVESPCSSPKLRCPIPIHLPCKTGLFSAQVYLDLTCFKDALFWQNPNCLHIVIYKNVCVGECLDQLHSLHLVCVKSRAVQIAKIQTSLHLYYRTKVIVQLACPHGQSGAGERTVNVYKKKKKKKKRKGRRKAQNKRTKSTKISSLFPKRGNRNTKRTEKHKNKMTHGKIKTNRLVE